MSGARQSPAIPLSPSSPPESGLKQRSKRRLSEEAGISPTTPPFMSVATKSYASSYGNTKAAAENANTQESPSSPTSSPIYTQNPTQTVNNSFPTPASSISAVSRTATMEDLHEHRNKRQKMDSGIEGHSQGDSQNTTQPMNHDRQSNDQIFVRGSKTHELPSEPGQGSARAREVEQVSTVGNLEQLEKDSIEPFLLSKSTRTRSQPNPKEHLLSRFGLGPLLKTVARTDPLTGEKINKLRKSYEGQIKTFALAGRNKSVKMEPLESGKRPLRSLVEDIPEDAWQEKSAKHPIEVTPDLRAKVAVAMQMQPGTVRNKEYWEDVLGHERPRAAAPAIIAVQGVSLSAAQSRQANGVMRPQAPAGEDAMRPRRMGKKRSYADNSFEGYGDGYLDDELDMDQALDSGDDDGGTGPGRKKRKKVHSFSISPSRYSSGYANSR